MKYFLNMKHRPVESINISVINALIKTAGCSFLLLIFLSCHPLISPKGDQDNNGDNVTVHTEEEKVITIGAASNKIKLAGLEKEGVYCVKFASDKEIEWEFELLSGESVLSSEIENQDFYNDDGKNIEIFFKKPQRDYVYLHLKYLVKQTDVTLSLNYFMSSPDNTPSPDNPIALTADTEGETGIFNTFNYSMVFFDIENLTTDMVYKINAVFTNGKNTYVPVRGYFRLEQDNVKILCKQERDSHAAVYFQYTGTGSENVRVVLRGMLAISYNISVSTIAEADMPVLSDSFEPDNGPITVSDIISDDGGSARLTGGNHTGFGEDSDWISFVPIENTTYQIGLTITDALYDESITNTIFSLDLSLMEPNGSEKILGKSIRFETIGENSIDADNYIEWTAPDSIDTGTEYFLHVECFYPVFIEYYPVITAVGR